MTKRISLFASIAMLSAVLLWLINVTHSTQAAYFPDPVVDLHQSKELVTVPGGPEALSQGIVTMQVVDNGDDKVVSFTHHIPSRSGETRIHSESGTNQVSITLFREGKAVLFLQWNRLSREVQLSDSMGNNAIFAYDIHAHQWVANTETAWNTLNLYKSDLQIMVAIYVDLTENKTTLTENTNSSPQLNPCSTYTYCPCTGAWERGFGMAESKSWCCYQATNDVNAKCWNQWCIGCCQLLDCDAECLMGDYMCFCGRSGQECGGPCN